MAGFYLFCAWLFALVLLFTPFTIQLDDIKIWIMHVGGGVLALAFALLWTSGHVELPPRPLWIPYLAFLGANALSCLALALPPAVSMPSRVPEADRALYATALWRTAVPTLYFYAVLAGWILLAASILRTKKMVELSLKLCILLTFSTTFFGLFHYGGGMSMVEQAMDAALKAKEARGETPGFTYQRVFNMVAVFARNREMLSTILNAQFFGNFLVMLMPATAAAMFFSASNLVRRSAQGRSVLVPVLWLSLASVSTMMALICIVLTFQKSSLLLVPVVLLAFVALVHTQTRFRIARIPEVPLIAVCSAATAAFVFYSTRFDLAQRLISMERSWTPRAIMWKGAIQMWLDNPVLGAGPGSYRVLFPLYRSPDYFLHRINNVTQYSHNWALDILAEVGLLGLLSYLAYLGAIFVLGWRAIRTCEDHTMRVAVIGYLVGLASILAGNMATPMTRWPIGATTLHAFAGLAAGTVAVALRSNRYDIATPAPQAGWGASHWLRVSIAAALAGLMVPLLRWQNTVWTASRLHADGTLTVDAVPPTPHRDPKVEAQIRMILEEAIDKLTAALRLDPNRPTTYYKLAFAYNRTGNQEGALQAYLDLTGYNPDYSEIQFNLGVVYMSAADSLGDPKDLSPEQRARALGLIRKSLVHFERAARQSDKPGVSRNYAFANVRASELTEGEESRAYARKAAELLERVVTLSEAARGAPRGMLDEDPEASREFALRRVPLAWGLAGDKYRQAKAMVKYVEQFPDSTDEVVLAYRYFAEAADSASRAGQPTDAASIAGEGEALLDRFLARSPLEPKLHMARFERLMKTNAAGGIDYAKYVLALERRAGGRLLDDKTRARLASVAGGTTPIPSPRGS
jgi:hypothetical protein